MTDIRQTGVSHPLSESNQSRKELLLILALAGLLGVLILLAELVTLPPFADAILAVLRLALGLIYVLYLPGYCLSVALFPRAKDLDGIERVGLSTGLSVAWVSVLALILDRLPWGLQLWPIFIGELLSILFFMLIATWRRKRLPPGSAFAPTVAWKPGTWWQSLSRFDRRVYVLCAGAILVTGLTAAWIFLVPSPDEFVTEFYILGREGLAEDYPRQTDVASTLSAILGIVNREREAKTYRAEIWAIDPWNDRQVLVNEIQPFSLAPGEKLERQVEWSMPWTGSDVQTEFLLYEMSRADVEPYRTLRLWLNVTD